MDWSIVHSLNGFLYHHDTIEDPLLAYIQAAEALFFLLLVVLCLFARHERFALVRRAAVAATIIFAAILDFGRVAVGFHYPTDGLGGALAALFLWTPPLRRRIDALSDFIGGWWDRSVDAVLKRVLPAGIAHSR